MVEKSVVLLSGGLDSAVAAHIAMMESVELYGLSFVYGQRHRFELECARKIADRIKMKGHFTPYLPIGEIAFGSALTTKNVPVPVGRETKEMSTGIPSTYVPARNIIFLSVALCYAETVGAERIYIGANQIDYSGYPDCRGEFIDAFNNMARVGMKSGTEQHPIEVVAPLLNMTKDEIIVKGMELGVLFSLTSSCYQPDQDGWPCGECDSCKIREEGFKKIGATDPVLFRKNEGKSRL